MSASHTDTVRRGASSDAFGEGVAAGLEGRANRDPWTGAHPFVRRQHARDIAAWDRGYRLGVAQRARRDREDT